MDLRTFMDFVRRNSRREYLQVDTPLSAGWELAAVVERLRQKMRAPLIHFSRVNDCDFPVATNICSSWPRVAKSLGISMLQLEQRLLAAYKNPIAPLQHRQAGRAPVRQHVYRGAQLDLSVLPAIRYTRAETAPYISAACAVARDPDSGAFNLSYHRLMFVDRRRLAIYMTPNCHLQQIFFNNRARQCPTPLAVFIGAHPLWSLGALAAGGLDCDEFGIIGGLLGQPLAVTPGLIEPRLAVPAAAEFVLEGSISHCAEVMEGPYGEGLGYRAERTRQPVFEVELLSMRDRAIYQDIVPGGMEHLNMTGLALRLYLQQALPERFRFIRDLHLPAALTLYICVQAPQPAGVLEQMMRRILTGQRFIKHVAVFDADIDIRNPQQVGLALATRVQADRDLLVLAGQSGNGIDPSECDQVTAKWGIDATLKRNDRGYPIKNTLPADVLEKIDLEKILHP